MKPKSKRRMVMVILAIVLVIAISTVVVILVNKNKKEEVEIARYKVVTSSSDSTYESIGVSDANEDGNANTSCFEGYLLNINDNKSWYLCFKTDIKIESEDLKSVTYTFANGMGCTGVSAKWPDEVAKFYYAGETETEKGARLRNKYVKILDKYCRENNVLPKRMVDESTGESYMIKNRKNPATYSVDAQPDELFIFVNESYYKENAADNDCQFLMNVTVQFLDDTSETTTYKIKIIDDETKKISISKTDNQSL